MTDYGLDRPGIESRWGEIFRHPDRPWGPPSLLYNGYWVFPGGKVQLGHAADHSPLSSAVVMAEYIYTSTHPLGHNRACNGNTLPLPFLCVLLNSLKNHRLYVSIYTYTHILHHAPTCLSYFRKQKNELRKDCPCHYKNVNSEDDNRLKDPKNMFISYFIFIKPTTAHTVYIEVQFFISFCVLAATHHHQGLYTQVHLKHNKV